MLVFTSNCTEHFISIQISRKTSLHHSYTLHKPLQMLLTLADCHSSIIMSSLSISGNILCSYSRNWLESRCLFIPFWCIFVSVALSDRVFLFVCSSGSPMFINMVRPSLRSKILSLKCVPLLIVRVRLLVPLR